MSSLFNKKTSFICKIFKNKAEIYNCLYIFGKYVTINCDVVFCLLIKQIFVQ